MTETEKHAIRAVTDATFEAEVIHALRPVIVDFWAEWCGPCKMIAPEMEKLAAKYDGTIDVVKVDVDANLELSRSFGIMSIPTIAFFPGDGKQPIGVVGFRSGSDLEIRFGLSDYLNRHPDILPVYEFPVPSRWPVR